MALKHRLPCFRTSSLSGLSQQVHVVRVKPSGRSSAALPRALGHRAVVLAALLKNILPSNGSAAFGQLQQQPSQIVHAAADELPDHAALEQLPEWAQRFARQIKSLPDGRRSLYKVLLCTQELLEKAEGCTEHKQVIQAYIMLATVDLISQAWQLQIKKLDTIQTKLKQINSQAAGLSQQLNRANMALSGCRYLRIEAVLALASHVHTLLDAQGHSPKLHLAAVPQPHTIGLHFQQLLQQGLGLDVNNPAYRQHSTTELSGLSWDEYEAKASDRQLCGEWTFCFWYGNATLLPAPYGKFSTDELGVLLTPRVVLGSLENGSWGRSLLAAALEAGLVIDDLGISHNAQLLKGAGRAGSASAWLFSTARPKEEPALQQRVKQFAVTAAAAAVTLMQQHQQQH